MDKYEWMLKRIGLPPEGRKKLIDDALEQLNDIKRFDARILALTPEQHKVIREILSLDIIDQDDSETKEK
jgi:hypothetical protein